jgi:hypothetical protein
MRKDKKLNDARHGIKRRLIYRLQFRMLQNMRTRWQLLTQKQRPNFLDVNLRMSLLSPPPAVG